MGAVDAPERATSAQVTFLFTDIEGSSKLWYRQPDSMRTALARHDEIIRLVVKSCGGELFKTVGDASCSAFSEADDAVAAAVEIQRQLAQERWPDDLAIRVRMAVHRGAADSRNSDYFGSTLNVVSRLLGMAHGGQILVSSSVCSITEPHSPAGTTYRFLGAHRLKGIDNRVHVYQLFAPGLQKEFPPLNAGENTSTNLPFDLSEFIGRKAELASIAASLAKSRLLTLVGTGGIGKTRLAIRVALDQLDNFSGGVWLTQLEGARDEETVVRTIAGSLSVQEEPGRCLRDLLCDFMQPKSMLLVLDNCEQCIEAAGEVVAMLLLSCPHLTVIATSIESLKVPGELIWSVPALTCPDPANATPESLMEHDASRLFVARASLANPSLVITRKNAPVVAGICAHLDGIPLAVELAAARVSAVSLDQIAERLNDRFRLLKRGGRSNQTRHQTLRATIDWSYDLLSDPERILLARLSVFVGGWTLSSAEVVCATGDDALDGEDVVDLLIRLIEKSMVIFDSETSRYRMLETIRQYAGERLAESGAAEIMQSRHAQWAADLAAVSEKELWGADQASHLANLDAELANLRVALRYYESRGEFTAGMRMAADLFRFWSIRGYMREGYEWLSRALCKVPAEDRTALHARALSAAGGLAWAQSNYPFARCAWQHSLEIRTTLGDKKDIGEVTLNLGLLALEENDPDTAWGLLVRSLELHTELEDQLGIAASLGNLALLAHIRGEDQIAEPLYRESLAIDRALGDSCAVANSLDGLAHIVCRREARQMLKESLTLRLQLADKTGITESLESFADLLAKEDDNMSAILLWAAAEASREVLCVSPAPFAAAHHAARVAEIRAAVDPEVFAELWREGRKLSQEEAAGLALETGPGIPIPVARLATLPLRFAAPAQPHPNPSRTPPAP